MRKYGFEKALSVLPLLCSPEVPKGRTERGGNKSRIDVKALWRPLYGPKRMSLMVQYKAKQLSPISRPLVQS